MTNTEDPTTNQDFQFDLAEIWMRFDGVLPEAGDVEGLEEVFDMLAADADLRAVVGGDPRKLWSLLNKALRETARKPWDWAAFEKVYYEWGDKYTAREELARIEAERDERRRRGGRPRTVESERAALIQVGLAISRAQAWIIEKNGTSKREHQATLARIFQHDPERCFAAAWALKTGSLGPGNRSRVGFHAYINSGVDQFEEIGPAYMRVRACLALLPGRINDVADLMAGLKSANVDIANGDVALLWAVFVAWRKRN